MRLIIAGLLIIGGGLAALALVWAFYSTQTPVPTSTMPILAEQSAASPPEKTAVASAPEADTQTGTDTQTATNTDTGSAAEQPAGTPTAPNASEVPGAVLQIEVVRIGPDGSAVFAGRGSAEADIHIFEQNKTLAQTTVAASGEWVAIAEEPLSPGNHLIIVELRTADGQTIRADRAIVVELAATGEDKPLVALVPMTQQAEAELIQAPDELVSLQDGADTQIGTQTDTQAGADGKALTSEVAALLVEPARLQVLTLSWAGDDVLLIKGASAGGALVRGALNEAGFTAQPEAGSGNWTAEINTTGLTAKAARLLSELLDEDGKVIASRALDFDFAQLDIGRDGSDMVVIEKGDVLWRIAYRTYGDGIRYLDIVKRNQTRITDPDLIYPAQIFALPEQEADTREEAAK